MQKLEESKFRLSVEPARIIIVDSSVITSTCGKVPGVPCKTAVPTYHTSAEAGAVGGCFFTNIIVYGGVFVYRSETGIVQRTVVPSNNSFRINLVHIAPPYIPLL